jgi:hypothetical protein
MSLPSKVRVPLVGEALSPALLQRLNQRQGASISRAPMMPPNPYALAARPARLLSQETILLF